MTDALPPKADQRLKVGKGRRLCKNSKNIQFGKFFPTKQWAVAHGSTAISTEHRSSRFPSASFPTFQNA